jgi:hypothetical protein
MFDIGSFQRGKTRAEVSKLLNEILPNDKYWAIVKASIKPPKIYPKKYYMVNIRNLRKPWVSKKHFDNTEQVEYYIEKYFGVRAWGLLSCKGQEVLDWELPIKALKFKVKTSKYPLTESMGFHKKKNTRRAFRHKLRIKNLGGRLAFDWVYPPEANTPYLKRLYRHKTRRRYLDKYVPLEN